MSATHQLLVYADDVSILSGNINSIKKNIETLLNASGEIGLDVNTEKSKRVVVSRHQNAGQNHNLLMLINQLKIWQSSSILD
jgi:hypothetical protein